MLQEYAQAFGAGWFFVTGPPEVIRDVTRRYGVFASKTENGNVDHTFLTSRATSGRSPRLGEQRRENCNERDYQ